MSENGFEYEALTPADRLRIVEDRLRQYEAEHFGHRLNRSALERAIDVPDDERAAQLDQIDRTITSIERSIELHRVQRDELRVAAS